MGYGILESHALRVTIYRRKRSPLVFGLNLDASQQVLDISITRALSRPAAVTVTLPGWKSSEAWWRDEISPMDFIQIDATVRRNPDRLSDGWRCLFFGFIRNVVRNQDVSQESITRVTTVEATCQMGVLERELFNYWANMPGTFGNGFSELLKKTDGGRLKFVNATNVVAKLIFDYLFYSFFPIQRQINGENRLWRDTHGYRFESDARTVPIDLTQFAPQASTWLSAIMSSLDVPVFFEFFVDMLPLERFDGSGVSEYDEGSPPQKRKPGLLFPDQDVKTGARGDLFILRPNPFPIYIDNAYDARAWDRLPTFVQREEVGGYSEALFKGADQVFTFYQTSPVPAFGFSPVQAANAQARVIVDIAKNVDMVGFAPLPVVTRRTPVLAKPNTDSPFTEFNFQAGDDYPSFLGRLNRILYSYHSWNDRFEQGTISGPADLRLELGSRYVWNNHMGYIEGYSHKFTPTEAGTTVSVTRVLPFDVYQGEFRETMGFGRKRRDEDYQAIEGNQLFPKDDLSKGTYIDQIGRGRGL